MGLMRWERYPNRAIAVACAGMALAVGVVGCAEATPRAVPPTLTTAVGATIPGSSQSGTADASRSIPALAIPEATSPATAVVTSAVSDPVGASEADRLAAAAVAQDVCTVHEIIISDASKISDPPAYTRAAARAAVAARSVAGSVPPEIAAQWEIMADGLQTLGATAPTDVALAAALRSTSDDPAFQAAQDAVAAKLDAVCSATGG